ncbi:hypothetical protein SDRG_04806 [Saprolegnia diclina VS20]|uniref:Helicase-associated domain-containing protein n=1 Tax=Saprolegnia diclina (strain VS20) TaxID=1156394 RepID=T0QUR8_SAPDV|nr:hypothetical protein SDRG_04806 [Saprolegnia diclina VS20]EQC37780.1 hypothetical protein SDRG_04806 [Saprolegnia diclina VS20]|eukprot:XP_008608713.1 hypothetical protein SDRG_04806 [Saprolegnia diclina VS20]
MLRRAAGRAAFSTYGNINFSPKKQRSIANVVKVYHDVHAMAPSHGTLLIPNEAPWPDEARGKDINLSRFRALYHQNRLDPSVVADMDALSFPWSARRHHWDVRFRALDAFLALHGPIPVPFDFVVPKNAAWPRETWGIDLGQAFGLLQRVGFPSYVKGDEMARFAPILAHPRTRRPPLTPAILVDACRIYYTEYGNLDVPLMYRTPAEAPYPPYVQSLALGRHLQALRYDPSPPFAVLEPLVREMHFSYIGPRWGLQLRAIKEFAANFGHLLVPHSFVIPPNATTWSPDLIGLRLGNLVNTLRTTRSSLSQEQIQALEDEGFVWSVLDFVSARKLSALTAFIRVFGHPRVPQQFVVPEDDSAWPVEVRGLPLGTVVKDWRRHKKTMTDDMVQRLDALGFVWDMVAWRQERVLHALQTFKALHGHLRVPPQFVVPTNDARWPESTWDLHLTNALMNTRKAERVRATWPPHRIAALEALGILTPLASTSSDTQRQLT